MAPVTPQNTRGILIVEEAHHQLFLQLEAGLRSSLKPAGPLQEFIFRRALESAWLLERCRLATETLLRINPGLDPLLDTQNEARYARIERHARNAENSFYKATRELGKLQTEDQFRHEVHTLTPAEREDDALFETTPQSLSEVCSFTQVVKANNTRNRTEAKTRLIALDTEIKALAGLDPKPHSSRTTAAA